MAIQKLPEYLINKLKAGEVVERPASVLKELVENSLDAGATTLKITINDGGKSLIQVEDDGVGIQLSDMDLVLERYATSKILNEQDLWRLQSYGFRGEALASIAEVSKISLVSKTQYAEIATRLSKLGQDIQVRHIPVGFSHGTVVSVEDLFYNTPARLKFLKSPQTEFFYCYDYFLDVALYHWDKSWTLIKNDKPVYQLAPAKSLEERILALWKKDWSKYLHLLDVQDGYIKLSGLVSDAGLLFGSQDNIKLYVNGRPVLDKIVRKALLDAYTRQIAPGEFPFALVMLDIEPEFVDVNVHPRKLEVKFHDPQRVYHIVHETVKQVLGGQKVIHVEHEVSNPSPSLPLSRKGEEPFNSSQDTPAGLFDSIVADLQVSGNGFFDHSSFVSQEHATLGGAYTVVGQLWKRYIVVQGGEDLYYVDQHALAERIAFENMKRHSHESEALRPDVLLQPLVIEIPHLPHIAEKLEQFAPLGFDLALLSEDKIIVYAVPFVLAPHQIDLEVLFRHLLTAEVPGFDHVLDHIYASKACKTSIKAGDPLSLSQMIHLVQEGLDAIPGMFVCQHGRPFFVKIEKGTIDAFFDR